MVKEPGLPYNLRLHPEMIEEMERIGLFEHRKTSEVLREWIAEKIRLYRKMPDYRAFVRQQEKG